MSANLVERPSTDVRRARECIGPNNFVGANEVLPLFGLRDMLVDTGPVPFSEERLLACRDTHLLLPVLRISIHEMQARAADWAGVHFNRHQTLPDFEFAREKDALKWHLVRMSLAPESERKTWDEQQACVDESNTVPSARVLIYCMLVKSRIFGRRTFTDTFVRTSSAPSAKFRIAVGSFDRAGFRLITLSNNERLTCIGLALECR